MDAITTRSSSRNCQNKCRSCGAPNDDTRLMIRMSDIGLQGNSYENTPSPSSIASSISIARSPKYRHRSTLKNERRLMLNKHRYRKKQSIIHTQLLNRQYLTSISQVFWKMQKQIKNLKYRARRVEQLLITRTSCGKPIIRIPRLTHDQIASICINQNENRQISEDEIDPISDLTSTKVNQSNEQNVKDLGVAVKHSSKVWINHRQQPIDRNRFCPTCRHEFVSRSNYLLHVRKMHNGILPVINPDDDCEQTTSDDSALKDTENEPSLPSTISPDTTNSHEETHQPSDMSVSDSFRVSINDWDQGEFRLRPRPVVKPPTTNKVLCDICNKLYKADYIKKHKERHNQQQPQLSSPTEAGMTDSDNQTTNNEPSEIDVDDIPIGVRRDTRKPIVIAATCLDNFQLELVEQFLAKFPDKVSQSSTIDSTTTHLIVNDRGRPLRAPLSMKLIEAIAHHCYCLSYRWITDCLHKGQIIPELPYEIEGDDTEVHPHDGPRRSRLTSERNSLFRDIRFMIKCTESTDAKMTNARLQELITTSGGQIIQCVTHKLLESFQIIVLCDMTYLSARRHNYEQCRSLGMNFVSSDWVLESILEYHLKPFAIYEEMPL